MADIELVIKMPEKKYQTIINHAEEILDESSFVEPKYLYRAVLEGTPLPKGHGRLGDLDELEKRISNFVEHDAKITDEYTVTRQRFIVDGIRDTQTIIGADKAESEEA